MLEFDKVISSKERIVYDDLLELYFNWEICYNIIKEIKKWGFYLWEKF